MVRANVIAAFLLTLAASCLAQELWLIKTERRRVFDTGSPLLGQPRFAWLVFDRYERPGNEWERLDCRDPDVNPSDPDSERG